MSILKRVELDVSLHEGAAAIFEYAPDLLFCKSSCKVGQLTGNPAFFFLTKV